MSEWKLLFHPEALDELKKLDGHTKAQAKKKMKQLSRDPSLGKPLGNKHGIDLTGYYKVYFFKNKYRIVYSYRKSSKSVLIIGINKRDNLAVYFEAHRRSKSD